MFVSMQSRNRKCCRTDVAIPAIFVISILLLSILTAEAAVPKQPLDPMMPEILEKVARQLPDAWHPRQMPNGDVQLQNPAQQLNARIDRHGIHLVAADEAFGAAVIVACDTIIIGAPETDLVGMLIDAGAAFVFQTFEAQGAAADASTSSGSACFMGTALHGSQLNSSMVELGMGILSLVIIFIKGAGRKRKALKTRKPLF